MRFDVPDLNFQNLAFLSSFIFIILISIRRRVGSFSLDHEVSEELKGFAILSIVFAHISFFLSNDPKFLYPLSILAGVGVNLFLFLSGFGLTSSFEKRLSIPSFYLKTVRKLFAPLWIAVGLILILDKFALGISYDITTISYAILGLFFSADIYKDLNSPLWYFTLTLFYYICYPIIFILFKKSYSMIALFLIIISYVFIAQNLPLTKDLNVLYKLHFLAFPAGAIFKLFLYKYVLRILERIKSMNLTPVAGILLSIAFVYLSLNAGVGESLKHEQFTSLLIVLCLSLVFMIKQFDINFLKICGRYSQQIFLIHWPFLYRYDYLFLFAPAWIAVLLSLGILIVLAWMIRRITLEIS